MALIYHLYQLRNPYEHEVIFEVMRTILGIRTQGVQGTHGEMFADQIDHIFAKPQLMALSLAAVFLFFKRNCYYF